MFLYHWLQVSSSDPHEDVLLQSLLPPGLLRMFFLGFVSKAFHGHRRVFMRFLFADTQGVQHPMSMPFDVRTRESERHL